MIDYYSCIFYITVHTIYFSQTSEYVKFIRFIILIFISITHQLLLFIYHKTCIIVYEVQTCTVFRWQRQRCRPVAVRPVGPTCLSIEN